MAELDAAIPGATHTDIGGLSVDEAAAGDARIKRIVYPPGWRWSTDMAPVTGTSSCQHVHVGFIARGAMDISYDDGRTSSCGPPASPSSTPATTAGWWATSRWCSSRSTWAPRPRPASGCSPAAPAAATGHV